MKFKALVSYEMAGYVEVKAESEDEAKRFLEENEVMPSDSDYVDWTYFVCSLEKCDEP